MIYLIGFFFIALIIIYYTNHYINQNPRGCEAEHANLMEDIPSIPIDAESLEKHATDIAKHYSTIKNTSCRKRVLHSLDKSYEKIIEGYYHIDKEVRNNKEVAPASEWLLDNIYLIEKEYKHIKHNMPKSYYKNLPVIGSGIMKGFPRIYHIATELVSHTQGKLNQDIIERFINSYQTVVVLTSGELWALPIMLRIALIQNIGKITENIVFSSKEKAKADQIVSKVIQAQENHSGESIVTEFFSEKIEFNPYFTERLLKLLRDNEIDSESLYQWIDENLEMKEYNIDKVIHVEHQLEAMEQTAIGNSINTIREVEALDWKQSFDRISHVEGILKEDPSGIYSKMDFESRDYYRHQIEKLSTTLNKAESYIAKKALECAEEAEDEVLKKHIGYYLLDDGLECLKEKLCAQNLSFGVMKGKRTKREVVYYLGTIGIGTIITIALFIIASYMNDTERSLWRYLIAVLVLLVPCSEIILSLLNWSLLKIIPPKFIPKVDLKDGVGEENRTIVVIPTILNESKSAKEIVDNLEVYFLANLDSNIYFAILGDFKDSDKKDDQEDEEIKRATLEAIHNLNCKYCSTKPQFYYLSRERRYNQSEDKWMGWERKRGKLMEFNALLRGDQTTSYKVISSDISELEKAKYIITLDTDTQLPRDSAKKLIGAMSHILNLPLIHNDKVVRGYGVMQPRVGISILSANKSRFSKIFSGETGMDTYSTRVSDIYQDLFSEGSFVGKGIYHIDIFNAMLQEEIPENTVLSHDLLEGIYTRAALVSDVEFIDSYPAYYSASSKRLHRWVRGDWQLLPWLKSKSMDAISKWKLLDNLRRSLLSPSIILLIGLSFQVLPDGTDKWILAGLLALISPLVFNVTENVVSPTRGISLTGKVKSCKETFMQVLLILCFLPYNGYLMIDAISRTLYRLYISKKNLLEWQTSSDVEDKSGKALFDYVQSMWVGSLISIVILLCALMQSLSSGLLMAPFCLLWFISPYIAWYMSKDNVKVKISFPKEEKQYLNRIARKTWAYFEDFVNEENHWLAPDNYQEDPAIGLAHRTSPTNIAMGLTSNLVAYDLGYISLLETCTRIDCTLSSIEEMEGYKGHLYNWYNTLTKEPLYPRYVSTVDSGNLAGYLWLVEETLEEYLEDSLLNSHLKEGLLESISLANEELSEVLQIDDYYDVELSLIHNHVDIVEWIDFLLHVLNKANERIKDKDIELYWNVKVKVMADNLLKEYGLLFPNMDSIRKYKEEKKELYESINDLISATPIKEIDRKIDSLLLVDLSLKDNLTSIKVETAKLVNKIRELRNRCHQMVEKMDFTMLYDEKRGLFSIGYDVEGDDLGKSYYDLLASEARQASFVAIAKGDVDTKHWFRLGRSMAIMGRGKGLVSWSGTMFEYLMPLLIMKPFPDTLFTQTYKAVVEGQKSYGLSRDIPWGISESAYKNFDAAMNYQYKAFGVPGIGLKRGLIDELVVSPYSTVMALQVDVSSSMKNLIRLKKYGLEGRYGFYESIDFTKDRMDKGKNNHIIKCFMVHHEGMSLMALDNVLKDNILINRFHNLPRVKATELLLQEKMSYRIIYERQQVFEAPQSKEEKPKILVRKFHTAKTSIPETQLLSNGSYNLMISNSGGGYGKIEDMGIYRWKEDTTTDNSGLFFYIKDISSNQYWSATYEPCKSEGQSYEVEFSPEKAEFKRQDQDLFTHCEIGVSSEDDAEVRKISVSNNGSEAKIIEITSYCEVTLAPFNADAVHPAFSNLFISTEYVPDPECIIANRRPRAKGQKKPYVFQCIAFQGEAVGMMEYETSRVNFIGRNRNLVRPWAMEEDVPLKNTVGAILDPIISIRKRVRIEPGETCTIAYTTGVTDSRESALAAANKYKEFNTIDTVFELAASQNYLEMKYLGINSRQVNLYETMASRILFLSNLYKEREEYIKGVVNSQRDLWKYGISGDIPIVLLMVKDTKDKELVQQMLGAHQYWSLKGLKVDLVLLNLENAAYSQPLQDAMRDLLLAGYPRDKVNKSGGIFLHSKATMEKVDMDLLMAISRMVVEGDKGSLSSQMKIKNQEEKQIKSLQTVKDETVYPPYTFERNKLEFFNEIGGFDIEKDQYVIYLKDERRTPAPWVNVIANENFGFMVSESGSSYTWYKNSRENKISPWSNDWVNDTASEALYLRDEESGDLWTITPGPIRDKGEYVIEHGFGYSNFKHGAYGILGEVTMFVARNDNVKICRVYLKNDSNEDRRLSLTYYAQMVLGVVPQYTAIHIATCLNQEKKYISAQNPYSEHFGKHHAYLKIVGGEEESFTGSRTEFLGRGRGVENPEALEKIGLSNKTGAGMDPCLAENVKCTIKAGQEKTLIVIFGQGEDLQEVEETIEKYQDISRSESELKVVQDYWKELLSRIQVKTPDKSMDIMLNGWLLYQTISCRLWARSAFYQSGGAYGFRDQLQDVMAAGYVEPNMMREHILYSATRQFTEGDVQHWWHPIIDSGIRTRFTDDLLWLPYVTIDYVKRTGDRSILSEKIGYLEDKPLEEGEDERYTISRKSEEIGTLYEHCIKAIERALKFGPNNIPLMGSGDWNDGMSEVGNKGKGESVWLGWFLYSILDGLEEICQFQQDESRVERYNEMKEFIKENLNKNAWDGNWYRRAYFDDGTPLGSIENDECQIDSLAQSWAVISKAGDEKQTRKAMNALEKYLVKEDTGIVLLFTPPFEDGKLQPGYIKGYVPGVRENGGQYTHGVTWVVLAMAMLGEGDKAWKVFSMLNPISHTKSYYDCERYKLEPYVIPADVYGREPHVGRGGWSWYTGAAGWMYRVAIEGILGLSFKGRQGFVVEPTMPEEWDGFEIEYRREKCKYIIKVKPGKKETVTLDGSPLEDKIIPYLEDGIHQVEVTRIRRGI